MRRVNGGCDDGGVCVCVVGTGGGLKEGSGDFDLSYGCESIRRGCCVRTPGKVARANTGLANPVSVVSVW